MAEESGLKPWEKTPGNRRLDHPDFRSVYETTYAKGTIKEFQVLQTNPIKVASMVKVEVDGQLHDEFIPLFYAPKEGFWDDTEAKATDFDPERKCFKRAWMSFRAGDEVVVLLQKGVPKAVLGHYDNVPRVGEDLVLRVGGPNFPDKALCSMVRGHMVWDEYWGGYDWWADGGFVPTDGETGPDGQPLNLRLKVARIDGPAQHYSFPPQYLHPQIYATNQWLWLYDEEDYRPPFDLYSYCRFRDFLCSDHAEPDPNEKYYDKLIDDTECPTQREPINPVRVLNDAFARIRVNCLEYNSFYIRVTVHPIVVGPVLYALYTAWYKPVDTGAGLKYCDHQRSTPRSYDGEAAYKDVKEWLETFEPADWYTGVTTETPPGDVTEDPYYVHHLNEDYQAIACALYAGVYTPELYAALANSNLNPQVVPISFPDYRGIFGNFDPDSDWAEPLVPNGLHRQTTAVWGEPLTSYDIMNNMFYMFDDPDTLWIRPHTRTELVNAGLWPEE